MKHTLLATRSQRRRAGQALAGRHAISLSPPAYGIEFMDRRPPVKELAAPTIQPKLTVSRPGDRFEREADQMAARVMRMSAHGTFGNNTSPESSQFMQRQLGNHKIQSFADKADDHREKSAEPRIRLKSYSVPESMTGSKTPDKSTHESKGAQDQNASVTSFATEARGVGIEVEIVGGQSTPTYPDGYRWTQTIDTNVPLGGTTSPYVDPRPNDDTKPFYWTDAEAAASPTTFSDHPSRNPPGSGTTTWDATLALNGVNGTTVSMLDSLSYGFTVNSGGTVTANSPISPGPGLISTHLATLRSEFGGWTFS